MKVVGLCGSPREKGNTEYFLNFTLNEIEKRGLDTELITLRDKNVSPCIGCYKCVTEKKCVAFDDDFEAIYQKMADADGILLGSPAYHGSMTPFLKCVLDRAGFSGRWRNSDIGKEYGVWKGTPFSGKVGAPLTVARRAGFISTLEQMCLWFMCNDFIVIGSHYWNMGIAGRAGAVNAKDDEEGLNIMEHTAENMASTIKKLKG
jgi:multimeric flavodoxin WrbA